MTSFLTSLRPPLASVKAWFRAMLSASWTLSAPSLYVGMPSLSTAALKLSQESAVFSLIASFAAPPSNVITPR